MISQTQESTTAAVILAGGKGQRMNGVDKGLLKFNDLTFTEIIRSTLVNLAHPILISCNRNREFYSQFSAALITDDKFPGRGPLAGIFQALQEARKDRNCEFLVIAPVDAPFVTAHIFYELRNSLNHSDAQLSMAHDGQRLQHLISCIRVNAVDSLLDFLTKGGTKAQDWMLQQKHEIVNFTYSQKPIENPFVNINDREALRTITESTDHSNLTKYSKNDSSSHT